MKKFMVLLLAMALMVGTASMGLACCNEGEWCTYDEFTADWEVVQHLWIGVSPPQALVWDPCCTCTASQNFDWGYAANGCEDFCLLVCMESFTFTANGCGGCDDPNYYPEFYVEMNGEAATFYGNYWGENGQFHCADFGALPNYLNCEELLDKTGTLTILADENTCAGYGTVSFSFTIFADCY